MTYHYTDASRETDPLALPDVEVYWQDSCPTRGFECSSDEGCGQGDDPEVSPCDAAGYYYAFGSPGCLWDSEPVGPFDTEAEALTAARAYRLS